MRNRQQEVGAHENVAPADCIDGFIEVFEYEDGSLTMRVDGVTDDGIKTIIAALQAGLEQKNAGIH